MIDSHQSQGVLHLFINRPGKKNALTSNISGLFWIS